MRAEELRELSDSELDEKLEEFNAPASSSLAYPFGHTAPFSYTALFSDTGLISSTSPAQKVARGQLLANKPASMKPWLATPACFAERPWHIVSPDRTTRSNMDENFSPTHLEGWNLRPSRPPPSESPLLPARKPPGSFAWRILTQALTIGRGKHLRQRPLQG